MSVSLIIPAFNEQTRIKTALEQYSRCLSTHYPAAYEILIVANGCTDQTVERALEFASACPQVTVIDIPQTIHKGGAILEGFRQARGEYIAFLDADGATGPESLIRLIEQLGGVDIAIGSRRLPASQVKKKQPLLRRIASRLFNLSIRFLFHLPYFDTQCGAKAFLAAPAKQLAQVVQETRWTFDVDLLLWAQHYEYKVGEVPVVWADQEGSKMRYVETLPEVLASLWRLKRNHTWPRPSGKTALAQAEEVLL